MANLAPADIYRVALSAGFPADTAVKMTAIALKESAGDPLAHNAVAPDDSYGLWQINMIGSLGPARLAAWGLTDPSDLFDPLTNARAAYSLWAGDDANLARNWYIDRGTDKLRYEQYLPLAQQAAGLTGGGGSTAPPFPPGRPPIPPVARPIPSQSRGTRSGRMLSWLSVFWRAMCFWKR